MKSKHLFFTVLMALFAVVVQAQTITGTVSDENGMPLPGATVLVTGTSNGVSTDFDGNFSIEANVGDTLTISFVGYASQSIAVTSMSAININLEPDNSLDEVIVTSLVVKRNVKALGYSVTQVEGSEVSTNKTTNAINSLQGKIAGVQITGNAAGAKGSTRVIIRGNSSLTGVNCIGGFVGTYF